MLKSPHIIEFARSNRSTCKKCGEKILEGTFRVGKTQQSAPPDDRDVTTAWYHLGCFR